MIVQAKRVQNEAKGKDSMVEERVIGAKEEKESMAKEKVIGAKEENEIGAKEVKDLADRAHSKERVKGKAKRDVRAHMSFLMEMGGIGGVNNNNGQEETGMDLAH